MPDDKESKKIMSTIGTAIMESLEKDVSLWADEMEQTYPEWRGSRIIKRSGNQYQRKIEFGFNNAHANKLEEGKPAQPVGRYVQQIKAHKRKQTMVRAHQRFYKNHKPIQLPNGEWRMISEIPKVKATKPVSKSAKKRYTGKNMEKFLAEALKQKFK
jgi:hypothetical protein